MIMLFNMIKIIQNRIIKVINNCKKIKRSNIQINNIPNNNKQTK